MLPILITININKKNKILRLKLVNFAPFEITKNILKMHSVLFIYGWKLFFYSNDGNEPIHIHAEKGEMEYNFWLDTEEIEIKEPYSYNLTPSAKKEVKKII